MCQINDPILMPIVQCMAHVQKDIIYYVDQFALQITEIYMSLTPDYWE